ncbi:MAG: methylated-DNA--[protein]-cysteine S-methyltransferase [Pseudomonadota bacterium]
MAKLKYLLAIATIKNYILELEFNNERLNSVSYIDIKEAAEFERNPAISKQQQDIVSQFKQYFENPAIDWNIDFDWLKISDFQIKVLDYLQTIALGETKTYGEIAKDLNTSARAVGNACRRNPFPVVIPCHRVVAKNSLGGYDGDKIQVNGEINGRLQIKYFLLQHEKVL